ncbi:cytochrome P450 family protein [Streptomyces lavendulocolor]|uniref:cytochrome P450 family protein n=1 Tax=Streptomyces lavendulocolor TaxID=67316 RepID=UPI003C2B90D1
MSLREHELTALDPTADPAQEARLLRTSGCPMAAVELPGGVPAWAAVTHEAVKDVLGHEDLSKDPRDWAARRDGLIPEDWPLGALVDGGDFLHQTGEEHARKRRLVAGAFKRAPIAALTPRIREFADELLEALPNDGGPVDIKEHYAYRLAIRVICEVLGVPESAATDLRTHFESLVRPKGEAAFAEALGAIAGTFAQVVEHKQLHPGDDLTTRLIEARDNGDQLTQEEVQRIVFLLVIAGHETTVNLITSAVHALLTDPAALDAARSGQVTWDDVVDETLRHSPPVRYALMRYATKDITIGGAAIAAGEPVIAALYAAGRDPNVHEHPDTYDLARSTRREHLAFGYGAHYCLGSLLARQEAILALEALFTCFPDLTAAGPAEAFPSIPLYGRDTLPVRLRAGDRAPEPVA